MSVSISCVRFVQHQAVGFQYNGSTLDLSSETLPPCVHTYHLIEVVSFGWQGSRGKVRVKRLSVTRALAYANKLEAGGWISEDVYTNLYIAIVELLTANRFVLTEDERASCTFI